MRKFLTLFAVAALFSAVACGDAKKDASTEEEATELMDEMNSTMEEVTETVADSVEVMTDSVADAAVEVMADSTETVEEVVK